MDSKHMDISRKQWQNAQKKTKLSFLDSKQKLQVILIREVTAMYSNCSYILMGHYIELAWNEYKWMIVQVHDWFQPKKLHHHEFLSQVYHHQDYFSADARGFFRTIITESPLKNILLINLSLFTACCFFFPLPVLGLSVHISFTSSNTMLQCLSKAFTLASNLRLFLQFISTWVLFFTDSVRTDSGPVWNSSFSSCSSSSNVSSLLGLPARLAMMS